MSHNWAWWDWVFEHRARHRHRHKHHQVIGRFDGAFWYDQQTGEVKVATQQVPGSTALTGGLNFVSNVNGAVKGPIGTISADNPAVTPTLSADGQSYNFTSPPTGAVTLTWHDPAGNVADFSATFTDQVVEVITGSFGAAAPGTTS